jgi:hypothetical protein
MVAGKRKKSIEATLPFGTTYLANHSKLGCAADRDVSR